MTAVKVCGITRLEDGLAAAHYGADAVGFVFAPSPRRVNVDQAGAIARRLPPFVARVGVFVDAGLEVIEDAVTRAGLDVIQLHGAETADDLLALRRRCPGCRIVKAIRIRQPADVALAAEYPADAILADTWSPSQAGGTGTPFPWTWLADYPRSAPPLILAGGLNPANVREALATVAPYGVDVSSGVEAAKGIKDPGLVRAFIREVRRFDVESANA